MQTALVTIDGLTKFSFHFQTCQASSHIMLRPISKIPSALLSICLLTICLGGFGSGMQFAGAEESVAVGLKPGDPLGTFRVIKIAGAKDDGVEVGQSLCYRCRYGSNPIVMVFARKASTEIDSLINVLEESVEKSLETQQMQRLCAFVVLVGQDRSKLNESAVALIQRTGAENIPAVVTEDATSGPLDYQLSSANDVTVVVAKDSQVVAVETFGIGKIEPKRITDHINAMLVP